MELLFVRTSETIANIRNLRCFLLSKIDSLTTEQLNKTPKGYPNNIIWNLGHMNAVLQLICYIRSELPIPTNQSYNEKFLSGTRPEAFIDQEEISTIKTLFITSVDRLLLDYEAGLFVSYTKAAKIEEVYGISVENIDDAVAYLLYHEGLHHGYVFDLMRTVTS